MTLPSAGPRVRDLLGVLDITRKLAGTADLDPLLAAINNATRQVLGCERASVFLHDPKSNELYIRVGTGLKDIRFPSDRGIAGAAFTSGTVLHVPDAYADERFNQAVDKQTGFRTRNILACPLVGWDGTPVGVMQAINKHDGAFGEWDAELLGTLAAQAGTAIQRQSLLDAWQEKKKLEKEMSIARDIQQRLLPTTAPAVPGYELAGWSQPAEAAGGDFFDYLPLPGGRLVVAIGDATGHGVGPALMSTACRAFARGTLDGGAELGDALARVNRLLAEDLDPGHFVTAFFGVLDPAAHRLTYLSAGQGPVLLYRAATNDAEDLPTHGLPLGMMPDVPHDPPTAVEFRPGDTLALMTDGFYEWANPTKERFGDARMVDVLRGAIGLPPAELIRSAYRAVTSFSQGTPQADDLTAVVVRRTAG